MRARRIYDGWNPGHPAVPPGQLSFVMNSSRLGHTLRVYQAGDPLGWPVVRSTLPVYIAEVRSPAWPLSYDVSTFYAQALGNPGLPWTVRDLRTGEEISGIGGSNDLSTWRTTSSKILSISSSRRDHDLWLVQPDGSSSHLIQGAFQGDYSTTPAGVAWWNPYYKFLIRTHCKNLLDWRIEDRTTGDMTETSLQFAHQNRDMNRFLGYEWIALAPPKNLSWLVHYMSGATIRWEIGAGASIDGGFILERRIGSGAWEEIESSIPAARAASPAGTPYQTTDIAASLGSNFYYRVRYTYGGRRSGPSPSVQILWPSDSDLDGIPDAWELEHFGHLGQSNLTDFDRDGINDRLEYTGNTDPRDRFNGTGCTLTVVSGQSHQVHPNFTATYPFKLLVTDLKGVGVGNWRVTFKTPTGLIATSRTPPGGRWGKSCVVEPDADGHALIYLRGGSMPASHVVTASVGGLSRSATLVVSNDLPPAKPINVAVTSISSRTLSISWEDGSAGDADLFTVERSTDSINWTSKGKFGRGVTSMEDTPPTSGIYHYRIISSYDHE